METFQLHELPVHVATQVYAAMGNDPSQVPVKCEAPDCDVIQPLSQMFSMAVVYRMPGYNVPPYQCENEQHFGCTHEHAMIALLKCLFTHIEDGEHQQKTENYDHALLMHIKKELV